MFFLHTGLLYKPEIGALHREPRDIKGRNAETLGQTRRVGNPTLLCHITRVCRFIMLIMLVVLFPELDFQFREFGTKVHYSAFAPCFITNY